MDLLERYLHAVKFFLPQKQQDDIVGRHGHPMIVAGRYRSRQQLIGPVFFPIYLFALKTGLGVALLVTAVLAAVNGILHGDPVHYGVQAMLEYPGRSLMVFAWTTLGFAGLDIAQVKFNVKHDWDPR
jgi:thiamine transporter ThiT